MKFHVFNKYDSIGFKALSETIVKIVLSFQEASCTSISYIKNHKRRFFRRVDFRTDAPCCEKFFRCCLVTFWLIFERMYSYISSIRNGLNWWILTFFVSCILLARLHPCLLTCSLDCGKEETYCVLCRKLVTFEYSLASWFYLKINLMWKVIG